MLFWGTLANFYFYFGKLGCTTTFRNNLKIPLVPKIKLKDKLNSTIRIMQKIKRETRETVDIFQKMAKQFKTRLKVFQSIRAISLWTIFNFMDK